MTEPRIPPLPVEQWDDGARAALDGVFPANVVDAWVAGAAPVPNVVSTMLQHPKLAGPWLAYNNVLLWSPTLTDRRRELLVLRVARKANSAYEWAQHVKLADRFGITAADIDAIEHDRANDAWTPFERALIDSTDQLVDTHCIADDTWAQLAQELDQRQLVELVFVVGTYTCLAMAFNSFGMQLDES
ncbi:MAG TPA: carboxymuconolactone decarboxylase family protein [Acidimicrobiia bacterium]|nr:carboxymuconolactone decarboxylase family protein [Acidimicrobiia bacterium]